ncbi:hypothetical protein [Roseinatronobacter monicus]|uniref:hypothetical protein n=1 Tax=Roseinatronobacter monicus TaxID=393481 RepID=UPI003F37FA34
MSLRALFIRSVVVLAFIWAGPIQASDRRITPEMISVALLQQGYEIIAESRTLLGRVRFVASNELIWREVVLDLSSGQIIRDYAVEFSPSNPPEIHKDEMPRGGTVLPESSIPQLSN